jgi:hypothetical protein
VGAVACLLRPLPLLAGLSLAGGPAGRGCLPSAPSPPSCGPATRWRACWARLPAFCALSLAGAGLSLVGGPAGRGCLPSAPSPLLGLACHLLAGLLCVVAPLSSLFVTIRHGFVINSLRRCASSLILAVLWIARFSVARARLLKPHFLVIASLAVSHKMRLSLYSI